MPLGRAGSRPMEICQSEAVSFLLEVMESNTAKNTKILATPIQTENGMRFLLSLGGYLVVFLSSEYANYINGVNIPIDGGLLKSM